jgi:hypothetical protein
MTRLRGLDLLMDDAEPMPAQPTAGKLRGMDLLMDDGQQQPAPQTQPAPAPQQQGEGFGEWMVNTVRGRQDPAYQGVGSVYDQFTEELRTPTANAATAGASDAQMADIVRNALGDRVSRVEKDSMGRDVFVTRGQDGQEQKGYLNEPGLDSTDVFRGLYGSIPYIASAGLIGKVTKGMNWLAQAIPQGFGAGLTSVVGDLAQIPMGSEQGIEKEKAAINTGLGFAGPPLAAAGSALWRRFVTIPGMVDSTGKLTQRGIEAARKAGLDPNDFNPDMAREFATSYAKSGDANLAASRSAVEPMGIPVTQGQQSKRPFLLNREEKLRRGIYGEKAEREMLGFDAVQRQRIEEAALGGGAKPGVGQTLNPQSMGRADFRNIGDNVQDTLQTARQNAKTAENQLWETGGVKELAATDEALGTLRGRIGAALSEETAFTPTGQKMAETVGQFAEKKLPVNEAGGIQLKQVQTVDQMRRRLLLELKSAEPGSDQVQAGKIYDAFNDWIGESAEKSLLSGDPLAAAQLVKARSFTREVRELFSPTEAGGRTSAGARRLSKAMQGADSGEGVIQALLGAQGSRSANEGTATALRQTKAILDQFGEEGGKQAWDDIRLAYWSRLVQGKNGEMLGPQELTNNLKTALTNQRTVMMSLYGPEEMAQIRRLMRATEVAAYRPPNASGSGYTVTEAMQEMFGKFLNLVPGNQLIRGGLEMTGLPAQAGAMRARKAMSQAVPVRRPNVTPLVTGAGSSQSRD